MPQRKRYLFVCVNRRAEGIPKGSCAGRQSVEIHAALKAELAARGLAQTASCLDACWAGPVVAVEPDGFFYGRVTPSDVPAIVAALAEGTRVERLVLPARDFDEATADPGLPVSSAPKEAGSM